MAQTQASSPLTYYPLVTQHLQGHIDSLSRLVVLPLVTVSIVHLTHGVTKRLHSETYLISIYFK